MLWELAGRRKVCAAFTCRRGRSGVVCRPAGDGVDSSHTAGRWRFTQSKAASAQVQVHTLPAVTTSPHLLFVVRCRWSPVKRHSFTHVGVDLGV